MACDHCFQCKIWNLEGRQDNRHTERHQASVVRRLDNVNVSVNKTNHAIHLIVIYPVDSVIHLSNNPGQSKPRKLFGPAKPVQL